MTGDPGDSMDIVTRSDGLLPGMLDPLLLKTISLDRLHGHGVRLRIQQISGAFKVKEGSLYPALHRLDRRGLIESEWGESENGRRARFYRLTPAGQGHLEEATAAWKRFAAAMAAALRATPKRSSRPS